MTANAPSWNLENFFAGGPGGAPFLEALAAVEARAEALVQRTDALPALPEGLDDWAAAMGEAQDFIDAAREVASFAVAWVSAAASDPAAVRAYGRVQAVWARFSRANVPINDGVARCDDAAFQALAAHPALADMGDMLDDTRRQAALLLPRAEEALAAELSRDGILAWGQLYDRLSSKVQIRLPDGEVLSPSQARNAMNSPDRARRQAVNQASQAAWAARAETCAAALTHITGTRQTLNDRRGVDELAGILSSCRMERATLDAIMAAAAGAVPMMREYLAVKARVMGLGDGARLGWADVTAPVGGGDDGLDFRWDSARAFVLDNFRATHPGLADFAAAAMDQGWVEAEDRGDKRPGAWCTWFPKSRQSRVFMTHGGDFMSTLTLAHELGHGYHNHVMRDLPGHRRRLTMTLAETASTFAENVVRDAALAAASSPAARLAMLDARLGAGAVMLMNIPSRYHFERALYRMRREGPLSPEALSEEMVRCQRAAYGDALADWDPTFWASKLHFYIGQLSFYNFPYTFGYLFSSMVYARLKQEGASFLPVCDELLRRSGWERAEPLAAEVLGVDLTDPAVWEAAVAPLAEDLAAFKQAAADL